MGGMYNDDIDSSSNIMVGNYHKFSLSDITNVLGHIDDQEKPGANGYPTASYDEVMADEGGLINPAIVTEL